MEPLLRDIHTPIPVSWWPLAPGWYGLAILFILFVMLTIWAYRALKRKFSLYHKALASLQLIKECYLVEHNNPQAIAALNQLLRQVGLARCPRENIAALLGKEWLSFLDARIGGDDFSRGVGKYLYTEAYKPNSEVDLQPLFALVERWIKKTTRRKVYWREVQHV